MNHWLPTFLEEKKLDRETAFWLMTDNDMQLVPLSAVTEYITSLPYNEQERIKEKLMQIVWQDGNVMLFFRYIAQAMVSAQGVF